MIDNGNIYSGKVGIEITDSWHSNYSPLNKPAGNVYFVYYDPKPDELTSTQKEYLKEFVDSFDKILYSPGFKDRSSGYRAYLDVNSFVDYFIIGELSRNVDAYKINECGAWHVPPSWEVRLVQDKSFANQGDLGVENK